jgi:spermidine synthase
MWYMAWGTLEAAMKPWILLGDSHTPDGTRLTLMTRDREHVIFADGKILMSSRMHGSEEALATLACAHVTKASSPRVLVGGLGLGYTLRATLDVLPPGATVVVAELVPGVVEWNRGPLGPLAGHPLEDRRVEVAVGDVAVTMRKEKVGFDAILLDVDNGPDAFTSAQNAGLYANHGVTQAHAALKPGGVLAVWSAWEDRKFEQRLRWAGFTVTMHRVRARLKQGGPRHTIFLGQRT